MWKNRSIHYDPVYGNGGSPTVVGDILVFSCDGAQDPFIVGLNKHTGEEQWRKSRNTDTKLTFSFSTPSVVEVDGQQLIVSCGSNTVDALDSHTGEAIWWVRYDGYSVIPTPVFSHGLVFVCTGYDAGKLLAIRPEVKRG